MEDMGNEWSRVILFVVLIAIVGFVLTRSKEKKD